MLHVISQGIHMYSLGKYTYSLGNYTYSLGNYYLNDNWKQKIEKHVNSEATLTKSHMKSHMDQFL